MRVLFLSPYPPSRVRVRPFSWITGLAALGHEVHLVVLQPPGESSEIAGDVRRACAAVDVFPLTRRMTLVNAVGALPRLGEPLQYAYSHHAEAEHHVEALAASGRFDVVHVEHMRGAALASRVRGVPVVFDAVDCISALFEETIRHAPSAASRLMARLDLGRSRRFEARAPFSFSRLLVTTAPEAEAFVALAGPEAASRVAVVGHGVDTDYFAPADTTARSGVVFTGKLSYHANAAAALRLAQDIMPLVWRECPDTPVVLAGQDPPAAIRALARNPRVTVTGYVADMRTVLARAAVAACPLVYGRGVQNKVLEAMASGVPVVMSEAPARVFNGVADRDYVVADTDRDVAARIVGLLRDGELRRRVGQAGREYTTQFHRWSRCVGRLEEVYRAVLARTGTR